MEEKRNQRMGEKEQNRQPSIVEGATNYHPQEERDVEKKGSMSQYGEKAWHGSEGKAGQGMSQERQSGRMSNEEVNKQNLKKREEVGEYRR